MKTLLHILCFLGLLGLLNFIGTYCPFGPFIVLGVNLIAYWKLTQF